MYLDTVTLRYNSSFSECCLMIDYLFGALFIFVFFSRTTPHNIFRKRSLVGKEIWRMFVFMYSDIVHLIYRNKACVLMFQYLYCYINLWNSLEDRLHDRHSPRANIRELNMRFKSTSLQSGRHVFALVFAPTQNTHTHTHI